MNVELCVGSVGNKALPVFVYFTCSLVAMKHVIVTVMSVLASRSVCLFLDHVCIISPCVPHVTNSTYTNSCYGTCSCIVAHPFIRMQTLCDLSPGYRTTTAPVMSLWNIPFKCTVYIVWQPVNVTTVFSLTTKEQCSVTVDPFACACQEDRFTNFFKLTELV